MPFFAAPEPADPSDAGLSLAPPAAVTEAEQRALDLLGKLAARIPGFAPRAGQQDMVRHIARTLADVRLGSEPSDTPAALALVQAGTGVGKSAAYLAAVVALALRQDVRVVVATATVALQEQLLNQDLPALSAVLDQPLRFALAKGRGRYACAIKLAQWAEGSASAPLWVDDPAFGATAPDTTPIRGWYSDWLAGAWSGDRDTLAVQPESSVWNLVAADRHTCTARQCPRFGVCSYYRARMALTQAQVIVANHDWVLASLGQNTLPALHACFWVFDEAHHLPHVALSQFAVHTELTATAWLDRVPRAIDEVTVALKWPSSTQSADVHLDLKRTMQDLAQLLVRGWPSGLPSGDWRQPGGLTPPDWVPHLTQMAAGGQSLLDAVNALGDELKQRVRDDTAQAELWSVHYLRLGALAPRLVALVHTAQQWLARSDPPLAKWVSATTRSGQLNLTLHASPVSAAQGLRERLWSGVRGAVLTSATLTTCGTWTHFLAESGLDDAPGVRTLAAQSPFDHAQQARLVVVETQADPAASDRFVPEMAQLLLTDLAAVQTGALVLFTSRAQLDTVVRTMRTRSEHASLCADVQVQGEGARTDLLARHRAKVSAGERAILFGMQSFGEGLDLPGAQCEALFITKLPFASPTHPVEQARAEWLRTQGGDPFADWVIPETARRLMQWTGRALRRVSDRAELVCYDRRLIRTSYGRRLLASLPGYGVWRRQGADGALERLSIK